MITVWKTLVTPSQIHYKFCFEIMMHEFFFSLSYLIFSTYQHISHRHSCIWTEWNMITSCSYDSIWWKDFKKWELARKDDFLPLLYEFAFFSLLYHLMFCYDYHYYGGDLVCACEWIIVLYYMLFLSSSYINEKNESHYSCSIFMFIKKKHFKFNTKKTNKNAIVFQTTRAYHSREGTVNH